MKDMNWISVDDIMLPHTEKQLLVFTKNGKIMVLSKGIMLDQWRIDQYAITHWSQPTPPIDNTNPIDKI